MKEVQQNPATIAPDVDPSMEAMPEFNTGLSIDQETIVNKHPLWEPLVKVVELKNEKKYQQADDACWAILREVGLPPGDFFKLPAGQLLPRIRPEDQFLVAQACHEIGLSCEVQHKIVRDNGAEGTAAFGNALKAFLLAAEMYPSFAPPAYHLCSLVNRLKPEAINDLMYVAELPISRAVSDEKALADFRERCLVYLLNGFEPEPYALSEEHFNGQLPLPEELKITGKFEASDPTFPAKNQMVWMLSEGAKLSINVANYYRHYEAANRSALETYVSMTRDFAGTLLNLFDIPRDPGPALTVAQRRKADLGPRAKNVVSAMTNLASAAQMTGDIPLSKIWLENALRVDPKNEYAASRLEALNSGRKIDLHSLNALIAGAQADVRPDSASRQIDWKTELAKGNQTLHSEIVARMQRDPLVKNCPELVEAGKDTAIALRVLFTGEKPVAEAYMNNLEDGDFQGDLWGIAYEPAGNLTVQGHISMLQLCVERKLLEPSVRLTGLIETLEGIRDSALETLGLPEPEAQFSFHRSVLNSVLEDMRKKR